MSVQNTEQAWLPVVPQMPAVLGILVWPSPGCGRNPVRFVQPSDGGTQ